MQNRQHLLDWLKSYSDLHVTPVAFNDPVIARKAALALADLHHMLANDSDEKILAFVMAAKSIHPQSKGNECDIEEFLDGRYSRQWPHPTD